MDNPHDDQRPLADRIASATQTRQEIMSTSQVRDLCQNSPHHQGYEVVYDTPTRPLTAREAYDMMVHLRDRMVALRSERPGDDDATIAADLVREDEGVRFFTQSHPTIYAKFIDRHTPARVVETLMRMTQVRMAIEAGEVDEDIATAALQARVLEQCKK